MRELVKNVTTGFLTFSKSLLIMWEITIFALVQSQVIINNVHFQTTQDEFT